MKALRRYCASLLAALLISGSWNPEACRLFAQGVERSKASSKAPGLPSTQGSGPPVQALSLTKGDLAAPLLSPTLLPSPGLPDSVAPASMAISPAEQAAEGKPASIQALDFAVGALAQERAAGAPAGPAAQRTLTDLYIGRTAAGSAHDAVLEEPAVIGGLGSRRVSPAAAGLRFSSEEKSSESARGPPSKSRHSLPRGVWDALDTSIKVWATTALFMAAVIPVLMHPRGGSYGIAYILKALLPLELMPALFTIIPVFWLSRYYVYPRLSPSWKRVYRYAAQALRWTTLALAVGTMAYWFSIMPSLPFVFKTTGFVSLQVGEELIHHFVYRLAPGGDADKNKPSAIWDFKSRLGGTIGRRIRRDAQLAGGPQLSSSESQ